MRTCTGNEQWHVANETGKVKNARQEWRQDHCREKRKVTGEFQMKQLVVMRSRSGAFWFVLACCVLFSLIGLAACGNSGTTNASSSKQTTESSISVSTTATTTATQKNNHVFLAELVGQPTAKLTQGINFQVTGQVKNMDKLQHNIYLQATLKDASGKVVGMARGLADNVQGGQTATFTIQGIVRQPDWTTISVVITKVSE